MGNDCLQNLREFGRKNILPFTSKKGVTCIEDINGDCLKAVLTGKIRPWHSIKTIQYHKNNMICISDNPSSTEDVGDILSSRESYPSKLTYRRTE